jgi:hypothetical protein
VKSVVNLWARVVTKVFELELSCLDADVFGVGKGSHHRDVRLVTRNLLGMSKRSGGLSVGRGGDGASKTSRGWPGDLFRSRVRGECNRSPYSRSIGIRSIVKSVRESSGVV